MPANFAGERAAIGVSRAGVVLLCSWYQSSVQQGGKVIGGSEGRQR